MVSSTRPSTADPYIVSLDIGASSVRALLFDSGARHVEGYTSRLPYRAGAHPGELSELAIDCLDDLHRHVHAAGMRIAGICGSVVRDNQAAECLFQKLFVRPAANLKPEYQKLWPAYEDAAWRPLAAEDACRSIGTGC